MTMQEGGVGKVGHGGGSKSEPYLAEEELRK